MLFRSVVACRSLSSRAMSASAGVVRQMSTTQKRPSTTPRHTLANTLNKELESQSALLKEDLPTLTQVAATHKPFLKAAGFTLQDDPASTTVRLVKQLDADTQLAVCFDVAQVVQRTAGEAGESEDAEEMQFEDGSVDNVEVEVEIVKSGVDGKLVLNCELDAGYGDVVEEGDAGAADAASIYITDARILPTTATTTNQPTYEGPDYATMDEELQTAMTDFLQSAVGNDLPALAAFIDAYSGSKEGAMYERWLSAVKSIVV